MSTSRPVGNGGAPPATRSVRASTTLTATASSGSFTTATSSSSGRACGTTSRCLLWQPFRPLADDDREFFRLVAAVNSHHRLLADLRPGHLQAQLGRTADQLVVPFGNDVAPPDAGRGRGRAGTHARYQGAAHA